MTASTAPAAPEMLQWTATELSAEGFGKARDCAAAIAQWHRGAYNSTRSASARARLGILTPRLVARAAASPHPEELLLGFDGIVRQLPVGTHLFVTLCADPSALTNLLRLVGTAPRLMAQVGRHPEVFEALVADTTDADRMSFADLLAAVSEIARSAASHDQAMERIHAFVRLQRQVLMRDRRVGQVGHRAGHHAAGHAEMDQHAVAARKPHQHVFPAPAKPFHPAARQPRRQPIREGPAQVGARDAGGADQPAFQDLAQAAHHRLDFRQFRHMSPSQQRRYGGRA